MWLGNSLICHPHSKAETWQFLSFRLEAYPFPFPFDFHCTASVAAFLFNLIFGSAQMLDWLWRHLCLCSDCCLCEPGKHTRTLTHMQMSGCEKATRPGQPNASEWDKRIGLRVDRRLTKGRPKLLARLKWHGEHYSPGWPHSHLPTPRSCQLGISIGIREQSEAARTFTKQVTGFNQVSNSMGK